MRPITIEEVDQDVKEIPVGKALGPDGFTTDFFHHCWLMVREGSANSLRNPALLKKYYQLSTPPSLLLFSRRKGSPMCNSLCQSLCTT